MNRSYDDIIDHLARPLKPIPTDEKPVLRRLDDVRAMLFDIYGTLLISASGDFAKSHAVEKENAFVQALAAVGLQAQCDGRGGVEILSDQIAVDQERSRQAGIDYPEVDIVEIWRRTVAGLNEEGLITRLATATAASSGEASFPAGIDLRRLAFEYEMRVNPVWPMPHARECLEKLHRKGLKLGVISNSQFYTIELCRSMLQPDREEFAFDDELQYYSYQHGRAKPGLDLFNLAAEALARQGIGAGETVYVGNDMLNDVMPAQCIGFRTAFFAGDGRTMQRRECDPRVAGVTPDLVITDLLDLLTCLD